MDDDAVLLGSLGGDPPYLVLFWLVVFALVVWTNHRGDERRRDARQRDAVADRDRFEHRRRIDDDARGA